MVGLFDHLGHEAEKKKNEPLMGRICYIFNPELDGKMNDTICTHCRKFMTLDCDHIEEFVDGEVE